MSDGYKTPELNLNYYLDINFWGFEMGPGDEGPRRAVRPAQPGVSTGVVLKTVRSVSHR